MPGERKNGREQAPPAPAARDLHDRYEELRARVVEGQVAGVRLGLGVFLRGGMVAWIDAYRGVQTIPAPAAPPEGARHQGVGSEVVSVLATMALNALSGAAP